LNHHFQWHWHYFYWKIQNMSSPSTFSWPLHCLTITNDFTDKSCQFSLLKENLYWCDNSLISFSIRGICFCHCPNQNIGAGHELFRYIHYETMYVMARGHYYISYQLVHVKFKCNNSSLQHLANYELHFPYLFIYYS
jgi:hypothetical protein